MIKCIAKHRFNIIDVIGIAVFTIFMHKDKDQFAWLFILLCLAISTFLTTKVLRNEQ